MRFTGYYWIRIYDTWYIAHWSRHWTLCGRKNFYKDNDFDEINETLIIK